MWLRSPISCVLFFLSGWWRNTKRNCVIKTKLSVRLNEPQTARIQSAARIGTAFNIVLSGATGSWFCLHTGCAAICNNESNILVIPVICFHVEFLLLIETVHTGSSSATNSNLKVKKVTPLKARCGPEGG
jgi:hypothetical protein